VRCSVTKQNVWVGWVVKKMSNPNLHRFRPVVKKLIELKSIQFGHQLS